MGIAQILLGNATEIDIEKLKSELVPILADNESLETWYKLVRDQIIFTTKRILFIDKQEITGKKVEYHTRKLNLKKVMQLHKFK